MEVEVEMERERLGVEEKKERRHSRPVSYLPQGWVAAFQGPFGIKTVHGWYAVIGYN